MSRDSIEDPWKETMNGEPRKDDEPQERVICQTCEGTGLTGYPPQSRGVRCASCHGTGEIEE